MKNGVIQKIPLFILSTLMLSSLLCSCGKEESTGFDKKEFDISENNDNSSKVRIDKIGNEYSLSFLGTGKTRDFSNENKVPWYTIRNRISKVDFLSSSITYLGTNMFEKINISDYIIPSSVTSLGDNCFIPNTNIYTYGTELSNSANYNIYYYSENSPLDNKNKYWYMDNDIPMVWTVSPENLAPLKILFIGNSFTFYNDIPSLTQSIGTDLGYKITCESITCGSHTLEEFSSETDTYGSQVYKKLRESNDYDYVILQEQSTRSYVNYDSFKRGASTLKNLVDTTQQNCEVRLYSTWGYESAANSKGWTIPEMELEVRNKYNLLSQDLKVKVHQVGKAFTEVYKNHKEINLYYTDNKHPSYAGSYLSALVHIESLFDIDVRTTSFTGELNQTTASTLQQVAYESYFINK